MKNGNLELFCISSNQLMLPSDDLSGEEENPDISHVHAHKHKFVVAIENYCNVPAILHFSDRNFVQENGTI